MSDFRLRDQDGEWTLNREEAATLWYALDAYQDTLEKQLVETHKQDAKGSGYFEELMFLHEHLMKVTKLRFEMRDDHMTDDVRRWLDTD